MDIWTHSGQFHADELFACAMLRLLPRYSDGKIIRSREPAEDVSAATWVDVGGEYSPAEKKFDHHQAGFSKTFGDEYTTRLSSAGLIYLHFGREILRAVLQSRSFGTEAPAPAPLTDEYIAELHGLVYRDYVLAFDAVDNGYEQCPGYDNIPLYKDATSMFARIRRRNPPPSASESEVATAFRQCVALARDEFVDFVLHYHVGVFPWKKEMRDAFARLATSAPAPPRTLVFSCEGSPAMNFFYRLEREFGLENHILYYVFHPTKQSTWSVQCALQEGKSFMSRRPLPHKWRGLRSTQLQEACSVADAVFVHINGFFACAKSREGALSLVSNSFEHTDPQT